VASFLQWIYGEDDVQVKEPVLISFREWLHSYIIKRRHNRVVVLKFSSLSESGFIPTNTGAVEEEGKRMEFSSLSESGFIPTWNEG